jgi:hypothetical protein
VNMSARTSGRIVGAGFLLAFLFYGGGSALVASSSGGDPPNLADAAANPKEIAAGVLLMLANSAIVAGIGVAAYPVLRIHHTASAIAYVVTRTFEAVMLTVGAVFILLLVPLGREYAKTGDSTGLRTLARVTMDASQYAYWAGLTGLALGSLLFCRTLLKARLVPRFIAGWGLVGYALLAAGGMAQILGFSFGLAASIPGGLFEVAVGAVLVRRGFPEAQAVDRGPMVAGRPLEPAGV